MQALFWVEEPNHPRRIIVSPVHAHDALKGRPHVVRSVKTLV